MPDMPDAQDRPVSQAYCAPGMKGYAQVLLALTDPGTPVMEHPYLAGQTGVVICSPGTPFPPQPDPLDVLRLKWALANTHRVLP